MKYEGKGFVIPAEHYETALKEARWIVSDLLDLDNDEPCGYDADEVLGRVSKEHIWDIDEGHWRQRIAWDIVVAEERQRLAAWNAGEPIKV